MIRDASSMAVSLLLGIAGIAAAAESVGSSPVASADLVLRRADFVGLEMLSLEDLLRQQAGIAVSRRGAMGSTVNLNITGSDGGRVQLVLDGIEIDAPEFEWPRLFSVPLAMVDSVAVWRTHDPARIAIWTRRSDSPAPAVDFDLGRGDLVSRTRRVELFTPPRAITVTVAYDELLRAFDDFSALPALDTPSDFGAYDNRALLVRVDLRRADDALRIEHYQLEENSHGSFQSQFDRDHTVTGRNGLVWERPLGATHLRLDIGHQAWDEERLVAGDEQLVTEARTHAQVDLDLPTSRQWSSTLSTRYSATSGDRSADTGSVHANFGREDVGVETRRTGRVNVGLSAGAQHDERADWQWTGRASLGQVHHGWNLLAQAGRGVTFAGWGDSDPGAVRTGTDAGVRAERRGGSTGVEVEVFAKELRGTSSGGDLFPELRFGPTRVAGALAGGRWRTLAGRWQASAGGALVWLPEIRGDPAGMTEFQARFDLRAAQTLRGGDLVLQLLSTWILDAPRTFLSGRTLPRSAAGDITLDVLLMQRADFFASLRNVTDARIETYPRVFLPGRLWWFGFRLRLFD